jgi:endoglucanase
MYETLDYLMAAPAVTGFEEPRRGRVIDLFSKYCDRVTVDVIGNVIGTVGEGERRVQLAGHYDQLGFMIRYIDEKGYASFVTVGGWDPRVAYGTRVKIWTGDGLDDYIIGTIGTKAAHLTEPEERKKAIEIKDMRIDFGASDKKEAEEMGVKTGIPVTADSKLDHLGKKDSDLVIGSAFDDVCAVASFIETLDALSKDPPKNLKVHVVATVQEEIGLRGATISAYNINPWCAVAVDVTHSIAPGVEASRVGDIEMGKGPVIAKGANFTRALWELMEREAGEKGIPYQLQGVPSRSGTDAWAMQIIRGGTISGLISVPNKYMHSPNEVVSLNDLTNIGKLLTATIEGLDETDIPHTTEVYKRE